MKPGLCFGTSTSTGCETTRCLRPCSDLGRRRTRPRWSKAREIQSSLMRIGEFMKRISAIAEQLDLIRVIQLPNIDYYGLKMRLDPVSIVRSRDFQKSKWQSRVIPYPPPSGTPASPMATTHINRYACRVPRHCGYLEQP